MGRLAHPIPNGDFSQIGSGGADPIPYWHLTSPVEIAHQSDGVLISGLSGTLFLYSGENPGFSRPPLPAEMYGMIHDSEYRLLVHFHIGQRTTASVLVIQYDSKAQIGAARGGLRNGSNLISFRSQAGV